MKNEKYKSKGAMKKHEKTEKVKERMKEYGPKKVKSSKVGKVMHEWKTGTLHSGSKKGPVVTNRKQAIAIALSEARAAKKTKTRRGK